MITDNIAAKIVRDLLLVGALMGGIIVLAVVGVWLVLT